MQTKSSGDFREEPFRVKAIVLVLALAFIGWGSLLLNASFSETGFVAKSDVPRWIGHAAGLLILLPGIAMFGFFLYGIGLPLTLLSGVLGLLMAFAAVGTLVAIFHWGAFFADPGAWGGVRIGPIGPRDVARIIIVWMDILVLGLIAAGIWLFPKVLRREALESPPQWTFHVFIFGPGVVALALHVFGAFDWIERTAPNRFPMLARTPPPAAVKPAPPARPLEHYLGTWVNPQADINASHRIVVRREGESVFIRAWWTCQPKDCDRGEGPAEARRVRPGSDQVTELRAELRSDRGRILTVSLVPDRNGLRARETARIGGKVILTDRWLYRAKG